VASRPGPTREEIEELSIGHAAVDGERAGRDSLKEAWRLWPRGFRTHPRDEPWPALRLIRGNAWLRVCDKEGSGGPCTHPAPPLRECRDHSLWLVSDGIGKRS